MAVRSSGGTLITLPKLGAGGKPMSQAAEEIAAAAREISGRWSSKIPASIKVSVASDGKTATITAGGPEAPAAYPAEGHNSGRARNHPVYADSSKPRSEWAWAPWSPPRPFMKEAADQAADKAADKWGTALVDAWTRSAGFR
jgi:hypothetical protein